VKPPLFFVIEGPEASGKTSFGLRLFRFISQRIDGKIIQTREPGSTHSKACTQCRNMMLDPNSVLCKESEIFLFGLDRTNHFKDVIIPNLKNGINIISDRCYDSTVAYQGYGRNNGDRKYLEFLKEFNRQATFGIVPDITIFLIVDPKVGMKRLTINEFGEKDHFEKEKMNFHQKVYDGYVDIYNKREDRNIILIDTTILSSVEVWKEAEKQILSLI